MGSGPLPCRLKYESVGRLSVSSSLQPPGLYVAPQVLECVSMLWGIFPTQGSNPCLLHCKQNMYCLNHHCVVFGGAFCGP